MNAIRPRYRRLADELWEALSAMLPDGAEYPVGDDELRCIVAGDPSHLRTAFAVLAEEGTIAMKRGYSNNPRRVRLLKRCAVGPAVAGRIDYHCARKEKPTPPRRCLTCRATFQPEHRTNFRCPACNAASRAEEGGIEDYTLSLPVAGRRGRS